LRENPEVRHLLDLANEGKITLLFSARDIKHNHARALMDYLHGEADVGAPRIGSDNGAGTEGG